MLPRTWEECKSDWWALLRGEYRVQCGMRGPIYRRWKGEERPMVGRAKYKGGFIKPTRIWVEKDQRWYSIDEYLKRKGDA
jgi:hypothetical protein